VIGRIPRPPDPSAQAPYRELTSVHALAYRYTFPSDTLGFKSLGTQSWAEEISRVGTGWTPFRETSPYRSHGYGHDLPLQRHPDITRWLRFVAGRGTCPHPLIGCCSDGGTGICLVSV
jgi:hypothetical protein